MADSTDPDLSLVTSDDLIDELARRCTGLVVACEKPAPTGSSQAVFVLTYRGGFTLCCGIAARANARMMTESDESE